MPDATPRSSLISPGLEAVGSCCVIFIFVINVLHFIEFFTSAAESAMQDFT